jgi:hypothetical protein
MDEFDISEYLGGGMDTGGFNFDTSGIEGLDLSQFTDGGFDTGGFNFEDLFGNASDYGSMANLDMRGMDNFDALELGGMANLDMRGGDQDANAADNIDVGGGYNPATGKGDAATAAAAARTGVTSSAGIPYGGTTTPGPTITGGPGGPNGPTTPPPPKTTPPPPPKGTTPDGKKGMDPMMMMMLMLMLSQMGKGGGGGSSSGASIPSLSANRSQLPYSPPSRPGAGGTTYFSPTTYAPRMAGGGEIVMAGGGISSLGGYSDGGRLLKGPGDGVSDDIPATIAGKQPARLANGEFVVPARIVSELGNGSTDAGADRLYAMMDRVQKARRKTKNVAADTKAHKYLPA